ncbi:ArsR family transcriptional regulator [Halorarum salinum]|uniref:ArsR family transcriptional regulator n=1 Tax=Halorarum salinum TaxID=2743089 RepID=A0A7D5LA38_9EURY|nr:ArsR family transcriptional regulator [Halobaculum salinum]QLG61255.1 ArsR family transcriptional regulator [Halobaculum salinum]
MRPTTGGAVTDQGAGAGTDGTGTDGEFDAWRALQKATDEKRAGILADVVGHPHGLPSVEELDYMNPPLSDDAVRRHLKALEEVGVVRERTLGVGDRLRNYPYKFYELTEEARELFDRNGLFPEEAWRRQYRSVEKTARIRELESMPRPSD